MPTAWMRETGEATRRCGMVWDMVLYGLGGGILGLVWLLVVIIREESTRRRPVRHL